MAPTTATAACRPGSVPAHAHAAGDVSAHAITYEKGSRGGLHVADSFTIWSVEMVELLLTPFNLTRGARMAGARADGALVLQANDTAAMLLPPLT